MAVNRSRGARTKRRWSVACGGRDCVSSSGQRAADAGVVSPKGVARNKGLRKTERLRGSSTEAHLECQSAIDAHLPDCVWGVGGSLADTRSKLSVKGKALKPLRSPTNAEESAYMRMRKAQNRAKIPFIRSENWFEREYLSQLEGPRLKYSRQAAWGYRIWDFWFHQLGVAIEIDGPEHKPSYDRYRDTYNLLRSGIIVLRAKNFDAASSERAIEDVRRECTWKERRTALCLNYTGKHKSFSAVRRLSQIGDYQEALRMIERAGLYCSYGRATEPSIQPSLF